MSWIFFAILAPALSAIVSIVDKYILQKQVKDYRSMPIYAAMMGSIFGLLFWISGGFPILSIKNTILILLTGMFTLWGAAIYFRVLAKEEASKVIILLQTAPITTLILSFLVLQETISIQQFLGFMIILFATIAVSFEKDKIQLNIRSSFVLMLICTTFYATANVLFKFVIADVPFTDVVSYESWGFSMGGLLLYVFSTSTRAAFHTTVKHVTSAALAMIFINEGLFVFTRLITFLAISMGSVSLVSIVGSTQIFFCILYGVVLTRIVPKMFEENMTPQGLLKKLSLAGLVFIGLFLMN